MDAREVKVHTLQVMRQWHSCFLNASSTFKVIFQYRFEICTDKSP